jgi:hypothetical protein
MILNHNSIVYHNERLTTPELTGRERAAFNIIGEDNYHVSLSIYKTIASSQEQIITWLDFAEVKASILICLYGCHSMPPTISIML